MLDRLKAADGAIELFTLLGVLHRLIQHILRRTQRVGCDGDTTDVQGGFKDSGVRANALSFDIVVGEFHRAPSLVNGGEVRALQPGSLADIRCRCFC